MLKEIYYVQGSNFYLGLRGLFKGIGPKMLQSILNAGFMMTYYENIVKVIEGLL